MSSFTRCLLLTARAVGAQETDVELVRSELLMAPVPVAPELLRGQGAEQVYLVRLLDPGDAQ